MDEKILREYAGVYRWDRTLRVSADVERVERVCQPGQLVAFDESGESGRYIRPIAIGSSPVPASRFRPAIESRIEFIRDGTGDRSLTWRRDGAP